MTLDYKELRVMVKQLNRVAGYLQFRNDGAKDTENAFYTINAVINSLDDEITKLIEEVLKNTENENEKL